MKIQLSILILLLVTLSFYISSYMDGFANPNPIPGYIIPRPIVPKKPSPAQNSNGGLLMIGQ